MHHTLMYSPNPFFSFSNPNYIEEVPIRRRMSESISIVTDGRIASVHLASVERTTRSEGRGDVPVEVLRGRSLYENFVEANWKFKVKPSCIYVSQTYTLSINGLLSTLCCCSPAFPTSSRLPRRDSMVKRRIRSVHRISLNGRQRWCFSWTWFSWRQKVFRNPRV